ncbi:MAG: BatA and WFA domain-containing protein [Planctomycetaceae bacterium]|nr:BatA and WFA domain-containing protein [Planctomycetaceae bacterium]
MAFLSPWALLGLLAAVPIVVMYLIRSKPVVAFSSTTFFWKQVAEQQARRSWLPRVSRWVSLLLQLAVIGLVVLAAAQPVTGNRSKDSRIPRIFVLDNSASMQAEVEGSTRFQVAVDAILACIRNKHPEQPCAIVTLSTPPHIVSSLTASAELLEAALRKVSVADTADDIVTSLQTARGLLRGSEGGQISIVTDGCFRPAGADLQQDVEVILVGSAVDNVGITQFQSRRSLTDPAGFDVLSEIRSFSRSPQKVQFELSLGDVVLDVIDLELQGDEVRQLRMSHVSAAGGVLQGSITPGDLFPLDDRALSTLPEVQKCLVAVKQPASPFLLEALRANPSVQFVTNPAAASSDATDAPVQDSNAAQLTVLEQPALEALPPGALLVINPAGSTDLWTVTAPIERPVAAEQKVGAPILNHVDVADTRMELAAGVTIQAVHETLIATASGEPLLAVIERDTGPVFLMTWDLSTGDLTLRTAFPILLSNIINQLRKTDASNPVSIAAGGFARNRISGASRLHLTAPDGSESEIAVPPAAGVGPLNKVGLWTVASPDPETGHISIACNLANPHESNLIPTLDDVSSPIAQPQKLPRQPAWFVLAGTACCLLCVEWLLFHRRITV